MQSGKEGVICDYSIHNMGKVILHWRHIYQTQINKIKAENTEFPVNALILKPIHTTSGALLIWLALTFRQQLQS